MSPKRRREAKNPNHPTTSKRSKPSNGNEVVEDEGSSTEEDEPNITEEDEPNFTPKQWTENGIIEHVELTNFMCHGRLEFKFGSNTNFVVGKNGSGKSAVMTAIVVGLGGSASCTKRGNNLACFIKTGKQVAKVNISLRNSGPDAYKPDIYGSRITIERRIANNGRSSYRMCGELGRLISEKRDELVAILDQFNIQVDNPVCILNQDASRNFLNSKNPKDKYKLFLKATQLDQIAEDYDIAKSKREYSTKLIEQKSTLLPLLEREVNEWKQKYDLQQSFQGLREKEKELVMLIAWAEFGSLEQELKADEEKLEEIRQQAQKFVKIVDKYKEDHTTAQQNRDFVEKELQDVLTDIEQRESHISEIKEELALKRQLQKNSTLECKKLVMSIKSTTKDCQSLEKHINDLKSTDVAKEEAERLERQQKIVSLEEKRVDVEAKCVTTEHHCDQLKNCDSRYKSDLRQIESEDRRLLSEIDSNRRKLENLVGSRTNHLRRFGNYVPDLVLRVEQSHRQGLFRQKPVGPLGAHVKLRDVRYSKCVETCIKPLLFAFCCDNHADQQLLEKLFKEVAGRNQRSPSFIVSKFANSMHDISRHKVSSAKYPCILDVLDIDNHVVTNCLIDQRGVEGVLLIENNTEARRIMQHEVPRNCREAFTATGDQLYPAPNFRYYSAKNDRSGNGILQENVESIITSLRQSIESLEADRQTIIERMSSISLEKVNNAQEIKAQEQELMRMRQLIQQIRRQIETLQNVVEAETTSINTFEEDLQALTVQLEKLKEDAAKARANFDKLKMEADEIEITGNNLEEELRAIVSNTYEPLKASLEKCEAAFEQAAHGLQHYSEKLKRHEEEGETQEENCLSKIDELKNWNEKCTASFGPRVTPKHPLAKLKEKYNVIQKRLKLDTEMRGDRIEVERNYLEADDKYKKIKGDIQDLQGYFLRLKNIMVQRKKAYDKRREYIAICVSQYFTSTLELRKYKGGVTFDHKKEILDIMVETSQRSDGEIEEKRSVQGLSGGERSFSTVAFMLSLWQTIQSPFRMMDEFDIFMDMVTRRISMDIILDFASTNAKSQFIILTPLDTTTFHASNTLRIFKMPDPVRGQSTLPFESTSSGQIGGNDDDDDQH